MWWSIFVRPINGAAATMAATWNSRQTMSSITHRDTLAELVSTTQTASFSGSVWAQTPMPCQRSVWQGGSRRRVGIILERLHLRQTPHLGHEHRRHVVPQAATGT